MKKIGLIGGMSWESSIEYYRIMNEEAGRRLGSLHSMPILMESYDFEKIYTLQERSQWDAILDIFAGSAKNLINAGAQILVIAANAPHRIAPELRKHMGDVVFFHIADAAAEEILKRKYKTVALIGTKYIMKENFYIDCLVKHGIRVVTPEFETQDLIHRIIFDELCKGIYKEESREKIVEIITKYKNYGIEAVVLGCTELPNLIKDDNIAGVPILNTAKIHALGAVELAMKNENKNTYACESKQPRH